MTLKTVTQVLDEAADILAEEGRWTQGEWHEPCPLDENQVSHCADGAIEYASGLAYNFRFEDGGLRWDTSDDPDVYELYKLAYEEASAHARALETPGTGIVSYNDHHGRTQEEVVAVLRGAADKVRAKELVAA